MKYRIVSDIIKRNIRFIKILLNLQGAGVKMTRNERIHGLGYCRSCLNETYGLKLKREDVLVYDFMGQCMKCGKTRHIVHRVKKYKTWKLIGSRKLGKEC